MNILIFAEAFYPVLRGGEMVLWRISQKLVERGHRIHVVTFQLPDTEEYTCKSGIHIHRPVERATTGKSESSAEFVSKLRATWKLYRGAKQDLADVNFDTVYTLAYTATVPGVLFGLSRGVPVVTDLGNYQGARHWDVSGRGVGSLHIVKEMATLLLPGQHAFRSPSKSVASRIESKTPKPVHVIPNPIDTNLVDEVRSNLEREEIRRQFDIEPDERLFLFVGALEKVKNVSGLLRVFRDLDSTDKLVVVGEGRRESHLKSMASDLFEPGRVTFTGRLSHERVLQLMSASDGLLLASESENFPNVVIEALAVDTPVVSTDVGGIGEVDSPNLHLVDGMEEFVERVRTLGSTEKDDSIRKIYSTENIADQFEEMFRTIAESGAPSDAT